MTIGWVDGSEVKRVRLVGLDDVERSGSRGDLDGLSRRESEERGGKKMDGREKGADWFVRFPAFLLAARGAVVG